MASTAAPPASRQSCSAIPARRVDPPMTAVWSRGQTGSRDGVGRWRRLAPPSALRLWQRLSDKLDGPGVVVYPLRNHDYDSPFSA
eukprot:4687713-Pleurochrysis_carterae.AAC.1